MSAIRVNGLSKMYRLYRNPSGRLKEALLRGRRKYHQEFWAIRDVTFEVEKGTTFGIIGRNGSGKSTLLQLVAGILLPTAGEVEINGRVSALLELGSGFDMEFTGRDNVFMNGAILGLGREEIEERFERIEQFANIGDFIDQPVKLYSSGMYVRLAFATAINVDPDILIVDEALAVGDVVFQHRCMRKIRELQEQGKTIMFVSHDTGAVKKLCKNALLLEQGAMARIGPTDEVLREYYKIVWNVQETDAAADAVDSGDDIKGVIDETIFEEIKAFDCRFGNKKGELIATALTDETGRKLPSVRAGMTVCFSLIVRCRDQIDMPLAGFIIKDLLGNELIKTNTDAEGFYLEPCPTQSELLITFTFAVPNLRSGSYSISAGFGNGTIEHHSAYDWIENVRVFTLENTDMCYGILKTAVGVNSRFVGGKKRP
ncbi:MAG: ABC transporter ATP-binding protein [Pseudomonadota bacterium]